MTEADSGLPKRTTSMEKLKQVMEPYKYEPLVGSLPTLVGRSLLNSVLCASPTSRWGILFISRRVVSCDIYKGKSKMCRHMEERNRIAISSPHAKPIQIPMKLRTSTRPHKSCLDSNLAHMFGHDSDHNKNATSRANDELEVSLTKPSTTRMR